MINRTAATADWSQPTTWSRDWDARYYPWTPLSSVPITRGTEESSDENRTQMVARRRRREVINRAGTGNRVQDEVLILIVQGLMIVMVTLPSKAAWTLRFSVPVCLEADTDPGPEAAVGGLVRLIDFHSYCPFCLGCSQANKSCPAAWKLGGFANRACPLGRNR